MARALSKRRSLSASDDEAGSEPDRSAGSLKRVKLEHGARITQGRRNSTARGSHPGSSQDGQDEEGDANGVEDPNMSSETSEGEDEDMDDEEAGAERFLDDDENLAAWEAARERRGPVVGSNSEAGVVKSIQLIDFMCHRNFATDFAPRMNFLTGHNGSGKSAVLTAIAVALGGKAAITGRGQGLKDLIRKGAEKATIILTITNSNAEGQAFKPEIYSPNIVIERTIDKSGSSTYKFRSAKDGRIHAHKREELTQLCQHFNITIDSPLMILTQDQARSFLQRNDDKMLYKFFLDGTQLTALTEQYEVIRQNLAQIKHIISKQEEAIPDQEQQVEMLGRQAEANRKLFELRKKITTIFNELAWAYVTEKEKEKEEGEEKLKEAEERLKKIIHMGRQEEELIPPIATEIQDIEEQINAHEASKAPVQEQLKKATTRYDKARGEMKRLADTIKDAKAEANDLEKGIKDLTKKIEAKEKAAADADPRQTEARQKMENAEKYLAKFKREIPVTMTAMEDKARELVQMENRIADFTSEIEGVTREVNRKEEDLRNLQGQSTDRLSAFGERIRVVTQAIDKERWNQKPIGPLGMHVQLQDMLYRDVLHAVLGQWLCSFAVTNAQDKRKLQEILKRAVAQGYRPGMNPRGPPQPPPVIQFKEELFDYSSGDKSDIGDTIMSKLRIDDEHVRRILINASNIERIFVARTSVIANDMTNQLVAKGQRESVFVSADCFRLQAMASGSRSSGPIPAWHGNNLFSRDLQSDIAAAQQDLQELRRRRNELQVQLKKVTDERTAAQGERAKLQRKLFTARQGVENSQEVIDKLQDKMAERPADEIDAFMEMRKAKQSDLDSVQTQLEVLARDEQKAESDLDSLAKKVDEIKEELESFAPEKEKKRKAMAALIEKRAQIQMNIKHWGRQTTSQEQTVVEARERVQTLETDLEEWTRKASNFCAVRVEVTRTVKQLEREKTATERAIADGERRQGVRTEDISPIYNAKKAQLAATKRNVADLQQLHAHAKRCLELRQRWWVATRNETSVRARTIFISNINKRGLEAKLEFNHSGGTLAVRVLSSSTRSQDSQAGPSRSHSKNTKQLSGGERSFSQVCLLLALWDTASFPIRCLDEWDVFMDAANRTIAAAMLVDGARESDGKQYIMITPQNTAGINLQGDDSKMILMRDPRANQGTLPFVAVPA